MAYTPPPESLGQRIGRLRSERGWTQADLAARLALSRVAVSHFEMGLAIPSERTVALLAGLFRVEPHELVDDTSYPAAKRDRLPLSVPRYTEAEHQLALLRRDREWLERLPPGQLHTDLAEEIQARWVHRLEELAPPASAPDEWTRLQKEWRKLRSLPSHSGKG
jgi:transcriptional regulator with XRE-family HTH domain